MTDNEFILVDRLGVIRDTINKYGEDNFYLSFSGGKDSTILHYLIDMALPHNKIPRVYIDTGIEYIAIKEFVLDLSSKDNRFHIIKPSVPIKVMLEKDGYPFKSKMHSKMVCLFQHGSHAKSLDEYISGHRPIACPKALKHMFSNDFGLKVNNKCCQTLKKDPVKKWAKENKRSIFLTGMQKEEGGQRSHMNGCIITDKNGRVKAFHPLFVVSEEWEDWFVKTYDVELCELYYPPYNFKRTGCKGCPFSLDLEHQLEVMARLMPNERKQCEFIWKPVYDEYRRIGYRLKTFEQIKLL